MLCRGLGEHVELHQFLGIGLTGRAMILATERFEPAAVIIAGTDLPLPPAEGLLQRLGVPVLEPIHAPGGHGINVPVSSISPFNSYFDYQDKCMWPDELHPLDGNFVRSTILPIRCLCEFEKETIIERPHHETGHARHGGEPAGDAVQGLASEHEEDALRNPPGL